jgi:hypothetical protein
MHTRVQNQSANSTRSYRSRLRLSNIYPSRLTIHSTSSVQHFVCLVPWRLTQVCRWKSSQMPVQVHRANIQEPCPFPSPLFPSLLPLNPSPDHSLTPTHNPRSTLRNWLAVINRNTTLLRHSEINPIFPPLPFLSPILRSRSSSPHSHCCRISWLVARIVAASVSCWRNGTRTVDCKSRWRGIMDW